MLARGQRREGRLLGRRAAGTARGEDGLHAVDPHAQHHAHEERAQRGIEPVVEDHAAHRLQGLGWRQHLALGNRRRVFVGMGQEAELGVGREDLQPAGRHRAGQQPGGRHGCDPGVAVLLHLEDHDGAQQQCDGGQHLVGDAEQRPQRVDAAQRVDHALVQEIAPGRHAQPGGDEVGHPALSALERGHETAQQVLQHEAAGAGAGVHRGQDEERLEQDREVVPEGHQRLAAHHLVQDLGHAHGQRRRAAGTGQDGLLADVGRGLRQHLGCDDEAPGGDRLRHARGVLAHKCRRAVHREVHAGLDARGRHQGHHRDKALGQHAAVADVAGVGLVLQQLGRRAGGDQRVEARHRTAGDGDEQEGEQAARPDRAGARGELRQRRHFQRRRDDDDADGQRDDGADLQEGGQVVPRRQQQPHRDAGGHEAIAHQRPHQLHRREGEQRRQRGAFAHGLAAEDGGHQQHEADHRHLADATGADEAQIDAHEQRDRNRRSHSERAPGRIRQRLHDNQGQHRQDDDHDHEGAEQRDQARHRAHLLLDEVAERAAITARRDEQHDEVLHRAGEHDAGQDPQQPRQIAHLRREHRADQRAGTGNRGEVVAVEHMLVGGHVVQAVVVLPGGRLALGVQPQHPVGDEQAVVAVGDQVGAQRGGHDPQRADRLAAAQGHGGEGHSAEDGNARPGKMAAQVHGVCLRGGAHLNAGAWPCCKSRNLRALTHRACHAGRVRGIT
mmetsp:Transcript_1545/g.2514  ORF Transcript_1545/g.2514 Transcript_1545/m.2514 type:complete len:727 (-) Transcript_1545:200-2380(-)